MKDRISKWCNRKWGNWVIHEEKYKQDINYRTNWKKVTTLKSVSNDGLIRYKTVKNY
jgi:hypothetical protein